MCKALMSICGGALRESAYPAVIQPPLHGSSYMLDLSEGGKPRIGDDDEVREIAI
jgi:hypothetical protein